MPHIENRLITKPNDQGDGLTLCDGQHYVIRNCIIDFSDQEIGSIDEALGITWGCSAQISSCVFRGAGKLVLCGSGDAERAGSEYHKKVTFNECVFENFSRRGPEAQDGMHVELNRCLIRNWGDAERFSVRSFGAWAHGYGSLIRANHCVFWQDKMFGKYFVRDLIGHVGQAFNDTGLRGLFSMDAWRPGNWRGLVASDRGAVMAWDCYANHPWIALRNRSFNMDEIDAHKLITKLEKMKAGLYAAFGGDISCA